MLHRSFKPAKCKTALKLAASRIKLLKNKREAQAKQLKRELAQLLESGQDRTARIRVEHLVNDEKTLAAYELLEIYCELIAARLPIIESQKNCPIDLKEAISSVIFASPRCADVPELMDIRKHFTAKYGKEFVSAAVELRPDCGVSRLLVEKLSAKAPDGPTKMKILSAIAEECNVKWDPKSFEDKDSKPPEDLLSGPNTFEKASNILRDPPNVQASVNSNDKGPPSVQVPPKQAEKHDVPLNFSEHHAHSSLHDPSATAGGGSKHMNHFGNHHQEVRPAGTGSDRMELRHSNSGDEKAFSMGSQNWNMEFKDAVSAAHAAAESAERASMAARAAVKLSSRENLTRQYSKDSQGSPAYHFRDEVPQNYTGSMSQNNMTEDLVNTSHRRNSAMPSLKVEGNEQDRIDGGIASFHGDDLKGASKSSSASLKSTTDSVGDDSLMSNLQIAGRYSRNNSTELKKSDHPGEAREFMTKLQDDKSSEQLDYSEESRIRKQPSRASSSFRSSTASDDHDSFLNLNNQKLRNDAHEELFNKQGNAQVDPKEANLCENATVVFDDSGSDDDGCKFDLEGEHKTQEYGLHSFSLGGESANHLFANTDSCGLRKSMDESTNISFSNSHFSSEQHSTGLFSESFPSSVVPSQSDNLLPATFDDSDGPCSESEGELEKSKFVERLDPITYPGKQNVCHSSSRETIQGGNLNSIGSSSPEEWNEGSSDPWLKPFADPVQERPDKIKEVKVSTESGRKFGFAESPSTQTSLKYKSRRSSDEMECGSSNDSQGERIHEQIQQPTVQDSVQMSQTVDSMEGKDLLKDLTLESGKELNLQTLTGGLRNKGYRLPPYMKNSSEKSSSSRKEPEDACPKIDQSNSSSVSASLSSGAESPKLYNSRVPAEANKRSNTRTPVVHSDSDDDSSADEIPQLTSHRTHEQYNQKVGTGEKKKSNSGVSTMYFDSESDREQDFPKKASASNARSATGFSRRTKASPTSSGGNFYSRTSNLSGTSVTLDHASEIRMKHQPQNKNSDNRGSLEQPRKVEQATPKQFSGSFGDESSKSSVKEKPSKSLQKVVSSDKGGGSKTASSSGEKSSGDKASHVHPKLPDYETITAHLQSLRQNRH